MRHPPSFAQEAVVEELRQEMQKLSNYKAAQQKLAGMETLGDEPKRAQVQANGERPVYS